MFEEKLVEGRMSVFDIDDSNLRTIAGWVSVFGDDIILPTHGVAALETILESLWFKINRSKTFTGFNFRESCGMDAFRGFDVTPAYILEPVDISRPTSVKSVVECSNNFFTKGLWETARFLESTIPSTWRNRLAVVQHGSGQFGLSSFTGCTLDHLRSRYNEHLHRSEVRTLDVMSKVDKTEPDGQHALHQWFVEKPLPEVIWEAGEARTVSHRMVTRWKAVRDFLAG
jgi:hypothetical protein